MTSPAPQSRCRVGSHQSGQVVIYALAMLLAVSLVVMMVFNSGQLTAEKIKLHNTADAVAYSVATVEARNLNYLSYTNRAILANHASMAQMISLLSLTRMADVTTGTIQEILDALNVLDVIPVLGEIIVALTDAMTVLKEVLDGLTLVVKGIMTIATEAVYALDMAIFASQDAMQVSTVDSLVETYTQVLQANDPNVHWAAPAGVGSVVVAATEAANFIKVYKQPSAKLEDDQQTKDYKRATDVMESLRDDFTKRRVLFPAFDVIKPFLPINLNGGTNLQQYTNGSFGWDALDTFSFKLPVGGIIGWLLHIYTPPIPLGGAAIQLGGPETTTFRAEPEKLVELEAAFAVDPLDPDAGKKLENQKIRYGGQTWAPAVSSWWPSGLGKTITQEKEQMWGALANDPLTVEATLNAVPGTSFQGIEVIGPNIRLPPWYFDMRSIKQLKPDDQDNREALDLVDKLDGPLDPTKVGLWDPNSDLGPSILVPLSKPLSQIHTTSTLGMGVERAALPDVKELRVLAKGQVYFKRPTDRWPRGDLLVEHRSLFDPYWDARLAHPKLWERNLDILLPD